MISLRTARVLTKQKHCEDILMDSKAHLGCMDGLMLLTLAKAHPQSQWYGMKQIK